MYPGLPSRLEKEMKQLYLSKVLHGDPERLNVSFVAFSILAFLPCPSDADRDADLTSAPRFASPRAEVQDPYRGPPKAQAHGVPRRCCACRHYEEHGVVLVSPYILARVLLAAPPFFACQSSIPDVAASTARLHPIILDPPQCGACPDLGLSNRITKAEWDEQGARAVDKLGRSSGQ